MKFGRCPNRKEDEPMHGCNNLYIAGLQVWNPRQQKIVEVPPEGFRFCLNCDEELVEALGGCGCVEEHSEACQRYCGPD